MICKLLELDQLQNIVKTLHSWNRVTKQRDRCIFPMSNKPFHVCIGEIQILDGRKGNPKKSFLCHQLHLGYFWSQLQVDLQLIQQLASSYMLPSMLGASTYCRARRSSLNELVFYNFQEQHIISMPFLVRGLSRSLTRGNIINSNLASVASPWLGSSSASFTLEQTWGSS